MKKEESIPRSEFDKVTQNPEGYRDRRGEWRPAEPVAYAPLFVWPNRLKAFGHWLFDYLFKWNLFFFAITAATWSYFQPPLAVCAEFRLGWIAAMFLRNFILLWIIYGGWHFYLYSLRKRGHQGKYSPRWQSTDGGTFLFRNQVQDNIFWSCGSGCITWTAYEVVTMWMYANGHIPYLSFKQSPVLFILIFLAIPIWREFHFYWIHRLIHWKPLYDKIHYLHHYNINPGPWSGLAMHPIEHVLYFSVTMIHWIIPSHPLHFLYNSQHTALTPADSHTGFEGEVSEQVNFGSYFHYLHHRYFDCNYGESTLPLDRWFGSFDDGARTDTEKAEAKRNYFTYRIDRVVEESPDVKSFYLRRSDGKYPEPHLPGQHLMFKIPTGPDGKTSLRFYTLSDYGSEGEYRISVKRESKPEDQPELPDGIVSTFLHDHLSVGDELEARGPLGDFVPDVQSRKPLVLIAGGIGITPILAMLKACLKRHPKRTIHLFLCFRSTEAEVFREEVEAIKHNAPNIHCTTCYSQLDTKGSPESSAVNGRLNIELLQSRLPDLDRDFYICGPKSLMDDLTEGLTATGLATDRIHKETFTSGVAGGVGGEEGALHEVTFSRTDKTMTWDSEYRNLLEFGESNGIIMEAGCMFGECGACSTKILEGEVDYNYKTARTPKEGYCLPCSCRPRTALILET